VLTKMGEPAPTVHGIQAEAHADGESVGTFCPVHGCVEPRALRGYCVIHYVRYLRIIEGHGRREDELARVRGLLRTVGERLDTANRFERRVWPRAY